MSFFKSGKNVGITGPKGNVFEVHYNEETGTIHISSNTHETDSFSFSATPVIMSRRFRRDIKKLDSANSDEKDTRKVSLCSG